MTRIPPDIAPLLEMLMKTKVRFVLAGSVAVQAWGADFGTPGDLDIIPATDIQNLHRLATVLDELDARALPVSGEWQRERDKSRWREYAMDDPRRKVPLPRPDPAHLNTFDTLFATKFGTLDVVPEISGTYQDIVGRANVHNVHGVAGVLVMSIEDLLRRFNDSNRQKDVRRVSELSAIQHAQNSKG